MAEGARLESVFTRKGNVGSNPTLSASFPPVFRELGYPHPVLAGALQSWPRARRDDFEAASGATITRLDGMGCVPLTLRYQR